MVPRSASRHRRVRRRGGPRFLPLLVVAVTVAGCATSGHAGTNKAPRVLGQPKGVPLAIGKPAPAGTGDLDAVSCPTAKRCWAVGVAGTTTATTAVGGAAVIVATRDAGNRWTIQRVSGGSTPQLSGVSCPTDSQCMAVGSNGTSLPGGGVVVTTANAGATWSPAAAPTNALAVTSVSCASPVDCTAVVSSGTDSWSAHSVDFGSTWNQEGDLPPSFQAGNDLACVAGGTCVVAGYVPTSNGHGQGAVAVSSDGGQTWALATVPPTAGILQSAACLSTTVCLAAGTTSTTVSDVVPAKGELVRSVDGGKTWALVSAAVPVEDVYGLACPSVQLCAMVGTYWVDSPAVGTGAVAQSNDGGMVFRTSTAAYIPITLSGVACPTVTRCVAVGGSTVAQVALERAPAAPSGSTTSQSTAARSSTTSTPSTGSTTGSTSSASTTAATTTSTTTAQSTTSAPITTTTTTTTTPG